MKGKLRLHQQRKHEKAVQKVVCPWGCKGSFYDLQHHIKVVHDKINTKFPCSVCNATLSSATNLKKHVSTVHEGARPFDCSFCGRDFSTKQHRDEHVKKTHQL